MKLCYKCQHQIIFDKLCEECKNIINNRILKFIKKNEIRKEYERKNKEVTSVNTSD